MKKLIIFLAVCIPSFAQSFPGSIYTPLVAKDNVQTALTSPMLIGDGVAIVASTAGWVPNMVAYICDATTGTGTAAKCTSFEAMLVTNTAPNVLTVTRAFGGTTAAAHVTGKIVANAPVAAYQKTVNDETHAIETALGVNLSNIPGSPAGSPVPVNKGGTGANTAAGARTSLGAAASGANADITSLTALSTPVPPAQGGTGVTVAQGAGTGSKVQLAAGSATPGNVPKFDSTGALIDSGTAPAVTPTGSAPYQQFVSGLGPSFSGIFRAPAALYTVDYNFAAQTPGGSLSAGNNTITMVPCPLGVAGTDAAHFLYISAGTGTAEAGLITSGTCTSGASAGTVVVSLSNTHSGAWTITSATSGWQEAVNALGANGGTVGGSQTTLATFHAGVTVPASVSINFTCGGQAQACILRGSNYPNGDLFVVNAASGFSTFSDMAINDDAGVSMTAGSVIHVTGKTISLKSIYINAGNRGYRGLFFDSTTGNQITDFRYYSAGTPRAAVEMVSSTGANSDQIFTGGSIYLPFAGVTYGMFISAGDVVHVTNMTFSGGSIQILIQPQAAGANYVSNIDVENCFFDTASNTSFMINNAYARAVGNIRIAGSRLNGELGANTLYGIDVGVSGPGPIAGVQIVGNEIVEWGASGIAIGPQSSDASMLVSGNVINSNNSRAFGTHGGLYAKQANGLIVTGNYFLGNTTTGIYLDNTSTNVSIVGNHLRGNTTPIVTSAGLPSGLPTSLVFSGNAGITDLVPAIASAATLNFPLSPNFTITGTTGVGAVAGIWTTSGTFITTSGAVVFTAGSTIGNTCTTTQNKPYHWFSDGTKVWIAGAGC